MCSTLVSLGQECGRAAGLSSSQVRDYVCLSIHASVSYCYSTANSEVFFTYHVASCSWCIGETIYLNSEVIESPCPTPILCLCLPLWLEPGCSPAHRSVILGDWRDPLDPDVDAQTIFSQFSQGREVLVSNFLSPKMVRSQSEASSRVVSPTGPPALQEGAVAMETNGSSQTGSDTPIQSQASQSSSQETNGQFAHVPDTLVLRELANTKPPLAKLQEQGGGSSKLPQRTRSMGTMMGRSDSSIRTAHVFDKEIEEVLCQESCTLLLEVIDKVASSHRELEEYH